MNIIDRMMAASLHRRLAAAGAVAVGATLPAHAQQTPATIRLLPEDAQRGLNGHQHNFYFLPPGVAGEKYVDAGFFGQRLRPFLGTNTEALAHLNLYKRQKRYFLADRLVAVAAFGVYGQQIFGTGEVAYFNPTQRVAIGVFAASLLATVFININTNNYLQRAVGSFNAGAGRGAVWPRMRPSGVGLGQAATGEPVLALRWAMR